ncbi:unnamed protein product [Notodromas monacha]|uniref:Inosine/uridine-preferring nucleoside hydrolase domain-containing protein n=1 Tax=Notodromas monacha TaxID=399045 RepID=A0A7R9GDZ9_9CRUS|nr:unnamed protein product [Notodromas monacha]CAG0917508.1 unnamed protein product [Notodromas monacha]
MGNKKLLIIDCDPGLDDAMALVMAGHGHKTGTVRILAITCVQGNTSVDNSSRNACRVLDALGINDVPVFKGAREALVMPYGWGHEPFHGPNGFGGIEFPTEPDTTRIHEEHGVSAITRLADEYPGTPKLPRYFLHIREISLVLLGPVTNAALAMRMDHEFGSKLKDIYVMGGNFEEIGKTTSMEGPEFNFAADPDAAFVLFSEAKCPLYIFSWELCEMRCQVPIEWRRDLLSDIDTPHARLQELIEGPSLKTYEFPEYLLCDQLAMAGALDPATILESTAGFSSINTTDKKQRGRTMVDLDITAKTRPNVTFVTRMDMAEIEGMIKKAYAFVPEHGKNLNI